MADRDRDRGRGRDRDVDRDAAYIKRHADQTRKRENEHATWGHTFAEHVDATDVELQRRAATGVNARGHDEGFCPKNATRWQSDAACVRATGALWSQPEAQQQRREIDAKVQAGQPVKQSIEVRGRLDQVLGPRWQNDVYGRSHSSGGKAASQWSADAHAVAVFRRQPNGTWYVYTCYPNPDPL
jgi:hypothetical protein